MAVSELKKVFLELSSPEEQEYLVLQEIEALISRLEAMEEIIKKRDIDHEETVRSILQSSKLKSDQYFASLKKKTDERITHLNSIISKVEDKVDVSDISLKDEIKEAKKEIEDYAKGLISKIDSTKKQVLSLISDLAKERKSVEESISEGLKEAKEEIVDMKDKFKSIPKGGGSIPLSVSAGGLSANLKYADINFIGATSVPNETTHKTDITTSGGGTWFQDEVPSGTKNGVNVTFTLAHTPTTVVFVYLNGQLLVSGGTDYTRSGKTLTLNTAPLATDVLTATYS